MRRRNMLKASSAPLIFVDPFTQFAFASPSIAGENQDIAKWMSAWMSVRKPVKGAFHLMRFADPVYVVMKKLSWLPLLREKESLPAVVVPFGFVTDFASIPQIFWTLLRPDGQYAYAAVIHDYLYWKQETSREVADQIFLRIMEDFGIDSVTRQYMFLAVRSGGHLAWEHNARLKKAGERRILKVLPENPLVKWSEWKQESNVFQ